MVACVVLAALDESMRQQAVNKARPVAARSVEVVRPQDLFWPLETNLADDHLAIGAEAAGNVHSLQGQGVAIVVGDFPSDFRVLHVGLIGVGLLSS